MKRRDFIAALGLSAAAVTFLEPNTPAESVVNFYPQPADTGPKTVLMNPQAVFEKTSLDKLFKVGDEFTVEGRYAMNPATRKMTPHLQRFIVTAVSPDRADCTFWPTVNFEAAQVVTKSADCVYIWPENCAKFHKGRARG